MRLFRLVIIYFMSQHRLALEDTVTTVIMVITLARSLPRCLSRQSRTLSLVAIAYVVSRDDQVRRLSRRSRTLSLEAIRYVVSRGDRVRHLLRRSGTSSLEAIRYVVSRVELAHETWLRDAWCYVHCTCVMYC